MRIVAMAAAILLVLAAACFAVAYGLFERMLTRKGIERKRKKRTKSAQTPQEDAVSRERRARRETLLACPHEKWTIQSADGLKLHARCIPAEKPTDRWVIGVHGYTSSGPSEFAWFFDFYRRLGCNMLLPDHRAHGESEGESVGMGVLDNRDIRLWIDELIRRTQGNCRVVLHGVSMGAATVTTISGTKTPGQVRGVVADCGYTSMWDQFAYQMRVLCKLPPFPILYMADAICRMRAGYGMRDFSPMDAVKQAEKPILFVHGGADDFVPTRMSRQLFKACTSPGKELLIVEGAVHAASYRTDPEAYERAVKALLDRAGME